jgi:hypothetical protein
MGFFCVCARDKAVFHSVSQLILLAIISPLSFHFMLRIQTYIPRRILRKNLNSSGILISFWGPTIILSPIRCKAQSGENGFDQFHNLPVGGRAFHHEIIGPEFERRLSVLWPVITREYNHGHLGMFLFDMLSEVKTILPR